jgi:hypothetical protein
LPKRLAAERLGPLMQATVPTPATDGGLSALQGSGTQRQTTTAGGTAVVVSICLPVGTYTDGNPVLVDQHV